MDNLNQITYSENLNWCYFGYWLHNLILSQLTIILKQMQTNVVRLMFLFNRLSLLYQNQFQLQLVSDRHHVIVMTQNISFLVLFLHSKQSQRLEKLECRLQNAFIKGSIYLSVGVKNTERFKARNNVSLIKRCNCKYEMKDLETTLRHILRHTV